jgi:hypothetical protein
MVAKRYSLRAERVFNLLEFEPVRRVPWREGENGRVIIDRPRPAICGLSSLLANANWLVTPRRIHLDDIGSFAWRRLDGATKVRTLAGVMRESFPESGDQLEERLGLYLRAMRRLQLISFPGLE